MLRLRQVKTSHCISVRPLDGLAIKPQMDRTQYIFVCAGRRAYTVQILLDGQPQGFPSGRGEQLFKCLVWVVQVISQQWHGIQQIAQGSHAGGGKRKAWQHRCVAIKRVDDCPLLRCANRQRPGKSAA